MTLHNPVWIHALAYDAPDFRQAISSLLNPAGGVVGSGDYQVTAPASGMSVNVAEGQIWIPGSAANQAQYYMLNDATLSVTVPAANATNPRIDLIVAQVEDAEYGSGSNLGQVVDIAGTPAPSPVAPSAPANSIVLAQVYVGAGVTSIVSGNITDKRTTITTFPTLGTQFGAFGNNGVGISGSLPSVGFPRWKMQFGYGAITTNSSSGATVAFHTPFPFGTVGVIVIPSSTVTSVQVNSSTASSFNLTAFIGSAGSGAATFDVFYLAIGW